MVVFATFMLQISLCAYNGHGDVVFFERKSKKNA